MFNFRALVIIFIIIIYGNFRHYLRICFNFFIIHEKLLVRMPIKCVCKLFIMYYSLLIRKRRQKEKKVEVAITYEAPKFGIMWMW